jgi:bifunctional non-homologous end joining protein LigD
VNRRFAEVAGRRLSLVNLEKNLYPSYGFTKAEVLDYYYRISEFVLPHLKDRALTLKRFPEGVEEKSFFEKRCPAHRPAWVATRDIPLGNGEALTACLVNDLGTLMWVQNLASIELHVPLARADAPHAPDSLVFDLDPGEGAGILDCARVALMVRGLLSGLGLKAHAKTSGRKGLHVYVALDRTGMTFDETKKFVKTAAQVLARAYPDLVTDRMAKEQRKKRVFINWSQNDASKTMVSVYSLRAGPIPAVSFPVTWDELEDSLQSGKEETLRVTHAEALARTAHKGDLFGGMLDGGQKLPRV